ncbi:MAG: Ig-like domain-containing protein [Lachnospiraceae bacterium]|nr:Ig-like domain-containing protein [Lachnospiraceae bacterium]
MERVYGYIRLAAVPAAALFLLFGNAAQARAAGDQQSAALAAFAAQLLQNSTAATQEAGAAGEPSAEQTENAEAENADNTDTDAEEAAEFSLAIDHQTLLMEAGDQKQLKVTVYPPDVVLGAVSWQTSDPGILTVSETGVVTAVAPGSASITVSTMEGDHSAKCAVAVYPSGDLTAAAEEQANWTKKIFYRSIADLKNRKSPWKRILCIGDSVTAGVQAGPGMLQWIPNYPLIMSELLGVPTFNHGVGGSSIWSGGNFTITSSLDRFEKADAVFLMGGYNDWFYGVQCPIGDLETPGSFTYDFNALCARISEQYPDADVFVVLPPTPHGHVGIEPYYDFSWLKAIEKEIAESYAFRIINLPAEDVLNGLEEDTWHTFFSDDVHMNDYGYLVLGTIITDKALILKEESLLHNSDDVGEDIVE